MYRRSFDNSLLCERSPSLSHGVAHANPRYFCLCYFATFGVVVLLSCVFVIWLLLPLLFCYFWLCCSVIMCLCYLATFAFVIFLLLALLFCYYVSLLFGYFWLCCLDNLYLVVIFPLLTSILLKSDSQFLLCIVVNIFIHKISITFQTQMLILLLMMTWGAR